MGERARVATTHYHVFMSEWYDGLTPAFESLPGSYEGSTRFDHQYRIYAEVSIMDIILLSPYDYLFLNVCN